MLLNLGGIPGAQSGNSSVSSKEIAAGLIDEIRSAIEELKPQQDEDTPKRIQALDEALKDVKRTLSAQLSSDTSIQSGRIRSLERRLIALPPLARELAYKIRHMHLTRDQYQALRRGPLSFALTGLRTRGILAPLKSHGNGEESSQLVYWFPPGKSEGLISAAVLSRPGDKEAEEVVNKELARVRYGPESDHDHSS